MLRYPLLGLSLDCDRPLLRTEVGGVAVIVCDTAGNRVLLHLSRDRGGYFGRVTKGVGGGGQNLVLSAQLHDPWGNASEECQKPQPPLLLKNVSQYTPPIGIAIHASNLYCSAFGAPRLLRKGNYCQYSSHLYRSTPPICIAVRLPFASQYF